MARTPPWKKSNPRKAKGKRATKLSREKRVAAKRSANRAGRKYPNLVDNMRAAASGERTKKSSRQK